jgi:hypothetical protein
VRPRISENQALITAFRAVHQAKERGEAGEQWQSSPMRRIRQIGPLRHAAGFWPAFETLAWRLVPVTCALLLVLVFFAVSMERDFDSDYLGAMAAEMEKPLLVELFDLEG